MTPLHLAHALLHTPSLLPVLAEDAINPMGAAVAGGKRTDLRARLLDMVAKRWDKPWGAEARHQLRGARRLFEQEVKENIDDKHVVLGALGLLARDLFVFHRGELMWERAAHLRWREQWSGLTLLEPVRAAATALTCLKDEGRAWRPRGLDRDRLLAATSAPLLPKVADLEMQPLVRDGLAEVHRHESLSKLPANIWWRLLSEDVELQYFPKEEAPSGVPWHLEISRARRLWRAIEALLDLSPDEDRRAKQENAAVAALQPVRPGSASEAPVRARYADLDLSPADLSQQGLCEQRWLMIRAIEVLAGPGASPLLGHCLHAFIILRSMAEMSLVHPPQGLRGLDRFKEEFVDHKWQGALQIDPAVNWRQAWRDGAVRWYEIKLGPGGDPDGLWKKSYAWIDAVIHDGKGAGGAAATGARCSSCAASTPAASGCGCTCGHKVWSGRKAAAEALGRPSRSANRPAIRFVLHFLRREDDVVEANPRSGSPSRWLQSPRWQSLREKVAGQARQLRDVLDDPIVGQLWVGIDAAAYELATPAEVFAPAFRMLRAPWAMALRDERITAPGNLAMRSLAASVHAGEEFMHLASGMRWVDEHVRFLNLRAGDRIGHGLAVGLEPTWWREKTTGTVVQSKQSRLDDLVWLRSRLAKLPVHAHLCHEMADEIADLTAAIYGRYEPPDVLLAAWALRDLDPLLGEPQIDPDTKELRLPFGQLNALDQAAHRHQLDRLCRARPEAITLWKAYTWDLKVRQQGEALMDVPVDRRWDQPLRDVQDELLQELVEKGVAIEANPSSNLAIATLGKLERHPIFRWLPVDPRERLGVPLPRVCVGSDDPAIFHTELLHEFALLAQAARETGRYTERDIRAWIDELRRAGLDLWFGEVLPVEE